jgi:preprotein translocase subunit SecG
MNFVGYLLVFMLLLTAVFLIVLVLIQRGKGGGLAGAFGGMGGQSAFGTKAGDLFTRITIGVAAFWIVLCIVTVKVLGVGDKGPLSPDLGGAASKQTSVTAPADKEQPPVKEKETDSEQTDPPAKETPENK